MKKAFGYGVKTRTPLGFCDKQKPLLGVGHHRPKPYKLTYTGELGDSFINAAYEGDLKKMKKIVYRGLHNVNFKDGKQRTVLHYASFYGHTHLVDFLLQNGSQINAQDRDGSTPMIKAVQSRSEGCMTVLLQNGANPNITDLKGNTALHYVLYKGPETMALKLLEFEADTEIKNQEELTPLLLALKENKIGMAKLLINNGANIHAADDLNRNVLMYAVRCDSEDLIKLLLEKGVDFHFEDAHRWTALKYAVEGCCKVSEMLLKYSEEGFESILNSTKDNGNAEDLSLASLSGKPGPEAPSATSKEEDNSYSKGPSESIPEKSVGNLLGTAGHTENTVTEQLKELDLEDSLAIRPRRPNIRKIKQQKGIAERIIQKCGFRLPGAVYESEELESESEEEREV